MSGQNEGAMFKVRLFVASTVMLLASGASMHRAAAVLVTESFNTGGGQYTVGTNNLYGQGPTVAGWTGNWNSAFGTAESPNVISSSLSYSAGSAQVLNSGGAVQFVTPGSDSGRGGRNLSTTYTSGTNATVYMSFMMRSELTGGDNNGYRAFELHNGGFDDGTHRKLQIGVGESDLGGSNNNYFVRLFNNSASGFAATLGANNGAVNFFVMKFVFGSAGNADSMTLWWNPENLQSESGSTVDFFKDNFNLEFDRTSLSRFTGNGGPVTYDEIRIGSSFAEVAAAVPEASAVLFGAGACTASLGVWIRRRWSVSRKSGVAGSIS
jgi:hypothetical protein